MGGQQSARNLSSSTRGGNKTASRRTQEQQQQQRQATSSSSTLSRSNSVRFQDEPSSTEIRNEQAKPPATGTSTALDEVMKSFGRLFEPGVSAAAAAATDEDENEDWHDTTPYHQSAPSATSSRPSSKHPPTRATVLTSGQGPRTASQHQRAQEPSSPGASSRRLSLTSVSSMAAPALEDAELALIHAAANQLGGGEEGDGPPVSKTGVPNRSVQRQYSRLRRPTVMQIRTAANAEVTKEELNELLNTTNFSKQEIRLFYKYFVYMTSDSKALYVDRSEFEALFEDAGLNQPLFRSQLWHYFTRNTDSMSRHWLQGITAAEIIRGLNPILRGSLEDVAGLMFDLFDLNHDGVLTEDEVVRAYSDLTGRRTADESPHRLLRSRRRRHSLANTMARSSVAMTRRQHVASRRGSLTGGAGASMSITNASIVSMSSNGESSSNLLRPSLSRISRMNIRNWIQAQRANNNGVLDRKTFVNSVVQQMYDPPKTPAAARIRKSSRLFTLRNLFLVCILALYEAGGLFALIALAVLPDGFEERVGVREQQIGALNSAYFGAAIISPLIGGLLMDRIGPNNVTFMSNSIVTLGATLQWLAGSPSAYWLLVIARVLIGFGLEITFITTNEVYVRLFPQHFGFMVGIGALLFNVTIFFAFTTVRAMADSVGFTMTLFIIAMLCVVSTGAVLVIALVLRNDCQKEVEKDVTKSDKTRITNAFASLAAVMTPHEPEGWKAWILPWSFYLTVLGNKSVGYFYNTFNVFSVEFYSENYDGVSLNSAALATGLIGLMAGIWAPVFGAFMDRYGHRARILALASVIGILGFIPLYATDRGLAIWISTSAFAIVSAFQDLGIVMIPLVVGPSRAGVGYGIYGLIGNLLDAGISYIAGYLLERGSNNAFITFSAAIMLVGAISWIGVFMLEKKRSFIERPLSQIVETSTADLHRASLVDIILANTPFESSSRLAVRDEDYSQSQNDDSNFLETQPSTQSFRGSAGAIDRYAAARGDAVEKHDSVLWETAEEHDSVSPSESRQPQESATARNVRVSVKMDEDSNMEQLESYLAANSSEDPEVPLRRRSARGKNNDKGGG